MERHFLSKNEVQKVLYIRCMLGYRHSYGEAQAHTHKQKAQMNISVAQFCLGKKMKGSMRSLVDTGLVLVIRAATSRFSDECLVERIELHNLIIRIVA